MSATGTVAGLCDTEGASSWRTPRRLLRICPLSGGARKDFVLLARRGAAKASAIVLLPWRAETLTMSTGGSRWNGAVANCGAVAAMAKEPQSRWASVYSPLTSASRSHVDRTEECCHAERARD
jgi:hypothetical protein